MKVTRYDAVRPAAMDLQREKQRIRNQYERQYGHHLPDHIWERIVDTYGSLINEEDVEDFAEMAGELAAIYFDGRDELQRKSPEQESGVRRRYDKPLHRRIAILQTVTRNTPGSVNLFRREFNSRIRVKWAPITKIWNSTHPSEYIDSETLRVEYSRAKHDNYTVSVFCSNELFGAAVRLIENHPLKINWVDMLIGFRMMISEGKVSDEEIAAMNSFICRVIIAPASEFDINFFPHLYRMS